MDLENIRTFCVVAQAKSFRKAAEILRVTQPGVSRRIQNLEEELGHPLLFRTPQYVTLTKEGLEFLPYAKRTIQVFEEGTNKLTEDAKEEQLVVGGAPTTCFNLLPEVFKEFTSEHNIKLSIYTGTSQQVVDMLMDQTLDVGFTTNIFPIPLLEHETIYMERFICVGRPELVKQYIAEGDFIKYPIPIILNNLNRIREHPLQPVNEQFINSSLFEIIVEANYLKLTERLSRIGVGFAVLPFSDVEDYLETGELEEVTLPDIKLPNRPVNMVIYKNHQIKNSVGKFTKLAKHRLSSRSKEIM